MKTKFLLCLGFVGAIMVQTATAQVARYYNLFNLITEATNDLTATIPGGTTNQIVLNGGATTNQLGSPTSTTTITASNIIINCHEFEKGGFTFQSVSVAGSTNCFFGVQIYGSSSKGAVWDVDPRWNFTTTNIAPGSQTYTIISNLDISGLDRLAFQFINGLNGNQRNHQQLSDQCDCRHPAQGIQSDDVAVFGLMV